MLHYKPSELRTLSMLGQRGVYGITLDKLAKENSKILAISADLKNTSGLDRFAVNHPDRFLNVGIAEQNMVGVAAGFADSGYSVFASTFANFASLRACEFVRHFMGYMNSPLSLIGFAAGFAIELFGNTHYGIEDISALRAISNLTILSPADGLETVKAVTALVNYERPAYLRLTGTANMSIIYKNDYDFQIGKAIVLKEGDEIAIISCGSITANALEAAKILEKDAVSCSVMNMHTIKPLDTVALDGLLNYKLIVTIEEHSIIGGLGSAIAEYITEKKNAPIMLKIGIPQGYKKAGGYKYMLEQNGLLPQQIANEIMRKLVKIT